MGLIRNPDIIRLTPDDPIPNYLGAKVQPGDGIVITRKVVRKVGYQAIIGLDKPGAGSSGIVFEAFGEVQVPCNASLVLVNAASQPAVVTLPHPADVIGWLSVVCIDNTQGIVLKSPFEDTEPEKVERLARMVEGHQNEVVAQKHDDDDGFDTQGVTSNNDIVDIRTRIFDRSNIEFHAAGDSLIFASNRLDTWYCIGKYSACWYA